MKEETICYESKDIKVIKVEDQYIRIFKGSFYKEGDIIYDILCDEYSIELKNESRLISFCENRQSRLAVFYSLITGYVYTDIMHEYK